jgi:hypothetical protein
LGDDQGDDGQGKERLGDSFSGGGFHLRDTASHKPLSVSSTATQILRKTQCLWG